MLPSFKKLCLLLISLVTLLSGCGKEPLYQSKNYIFGTLVDISIYDESDKKARAAAISVIQHLQRLHNQLHPWEMGSELAQLNDAFAHENRAVPISSNLAEIITSAKKLSVQSDGLFNPAIGGLIVTWGFQRDEFKAINVDKTAIQQWVTANPKMTDLVIENGKIYTKNNSVRLDLGGFAKGYALDIARQDLLDAGIKNALINLGGNIIALGQHGDKPWRVGIQHPREAGAIATLDLLDGWAIGTSGDYQRYFELNGKRYCHIIDPRTGYPVQGVEAVTVLIPPAINAGLLSDVASKPIFISVVGERLKAAKQMGVTDFMLIDGQGHVFATASMQQHITLTDPNAKLATLH